MALHCPFHGIGSVGANHRSFREMDSFSLSVVRYVFRETEREINCIVSSLYLEGRDHYRYRPSNIYFNGNVTETQVPLPGELFIVTVPFNSKTLSLIPSKP